MFHYHRYSKDEVLASLRPHPRDFLEAFAEQLSLWKKATTVLRVPWGQAELALENGRVTICGYPLHPYVMWRLSSYLLGVKANRWDWWLENPDLLLEALRREGPYQSDEMMQLRVINNEVVVATNLMIDLGDHYDYFEPVLEKLYHGATISSSSVSLLGYSIHPIWTHVNYVRFSSVSRSYHSAVRLDANYLFNNQLRGRAYLAMMLYDLNWDAMLNLDTLWSVRTKALTRTAVDNLLEQFERQLEKKSGTMGVMFKTHMKKIHSLARKQVDDRWRREVTPELMRYLSLTRAREAIRRFQDSGRESMLDFGLAVAACSTELRYDQQLHLSRWFLKKMRAAP